jgi:hypothetical protein
MDLARAVCTKIDATSEGVRAFLDLVNSDAVLNSFELTSAAANSLFRADFGKTLVFHSQDTAQWVATALRVHGERLMTTGSDTRVAPKGWPLDFAPSIFTWGLLTNARTLSQWLLCRVAKPPGSFDPTCLVTAWTGLSRWLVGRRAASSPFFSDWVVFNMIDFCVESLMKAAPRCVFTNAVRAALVDSMIIVLEWMDMCSGKSNCNADIQALWSLECVAALHKGLTRLSRSSVQCLVRGVETVDAMLSFERCAADRASLVNLRAGFCNAIETLPRMAVEDLAAAFEGVKLE